MIVFHSLRRRALTFALAALSTPPAGIALGDAATSPRNLRRLERKHAKAHSPRVYRHQHR